MNGRRIIKFTRLVASFLVIMMLMSMLPSNLFTVFAATEEHPDFRPYCLPFGSGP
jgi:hypothetical protein